MLYRNQLDETGVWIRLKRKVQATNITWISLMGWKVWDGLSIRVERKRLKCPGASLGKWGQGLMSGGGGERQMPRG